jgi:hypothetical protein
VTAKALVDRVLLEGLKIIITIFILTAALMACGAFIMLLGSLLGFW